MGDTTESQYAPKQRAKTIFLHVDSKETLQINCIIEDCISSGVRGIRKTPKLKDLYLTSDSTEWTTIINLPIGVTKWRLCKEKFRFLAYSFSFFY